MCKPCFSLACVSRRNMQSHSRKSDLPFGFARRILYAATNGHIKGAMPMALFRLLSHAIPASPHNTPSITFNGGKPQTMVIAEAQGLRERGKDERLHLRDDDAFRPERCMHCGAVTGPYVPWTDNHDRWAAHPFSCVKG